METELLFFKQPFCYESHHFWIISYGNRELSYEICQSKQPLILSLWQDNEKTKECEVGLAMKSRRYLLFQMLVASHLKYVDFTYHECDVACVWNIRYTLNNYNKWNSHIMSVMLYVSEILDTFLKEKKKIFWQIE